MKRVLIADDIIENIYFLEVLLKGNGFDAVTAENGAKALALARSTPPDLIISDILMPVMDGYALCRELKADPDLKKIPFIFYTATFTSAKDEALALSLGADRFVIKPQEPELLMNIIQELLAAPRPAEATMPTDEGTIQKEYGEALFRKLEKKVACLEQANLELKRREKELLLAREAAECANRSKMRFLSIMSHELRTPLNAIIGALQLAELEKSGNEFMTQAAKNAVFSMVGMIDNILEMSRIESAQFTASPTPVDLRDLADAVAKLFSYAAESKGIQLNVTVADNLPPLVTADSGHLRQILVHLMSNAIKFTEQGGIDLRLTAEETSIPEKTILRIAVQDSGIGIDPVNHRAIFDLFTQLDDSHTRPYDGIGLGLTLTKRLVELMGGSISVESRLGKGSTFTLLLPLHTATVPPATTSSDV